MGSFIILNKNESLFERLQTAQSDIECYKVIEERMTGSGRIEYWTYPMYAEISEDVVSGKALYHPKHQPNLKEPKVEKPVTVKIGDGFIHSYMNISDAIAFMETSCVGYPETRPVIYKCTIPQCTQYIKTLDNRLCMEGTPCFASSAIQFEAPVLERVCGVTREYHKIEKPEKKKKFGIIIDETQINGDVYDDDDE